MQIITDETFQKKLLKLELTFRLSNPINDAIDETLPQLYLFFKTTVIECS